MQPPLPGQGLEYLPLIERAAVSLAIGGMIGMEREWAHKDVGVRTFALIALSFTLAWTVSPTAAYILMAAIIPLLTLMNWRSFARENSSRGKAERVWRLGNMCARISRSAAGR